VSGKVLSRHMVICDGDCGSTVGENGEYPTAIDSRTAAAERGWIIVPKIKSNGKPARLPDKLNRAGAYVHDVCPACQPTFKPAKLQRSGGGAWWTDEIARLRDENERLRERRR
jgi:hypothetical protein